MFFVFPLVNELSEPVQTTDYWTRTETFSMSHIKVYLNLVLHRTSCSAQEPQSRILLN